jgi:hypothetical protein
MGVTWACRGQRSRNRFSRVGMEINASRRRAVNCQQRRDLPLFSESTPDAFAGIASPMGGPCTHPAKGGAQARTAGLVLRRGARDQEHIGSAKREGREPACASAVRRLCSGHLARRRVESRSHRGAPRPARDWRRGTGSAAGLAVHNLTIASNCERVSSPRQRGQLLPPGQLTSAGSRLGGASVRDDRPRCHDVHDAA